MKNWLGILFFFIVTVASATHNRSGEITYKRIQPFTTTVGGVQVPYFRYLITIIKYTDDATKATQNNDVADRCTDSIAFGDGTSAIVDRSNGGTPLCTGCTACGCNHCGELIIIENGYRVKKNIYITEHVFPSAGSYLIRSFDRNRNKDVVNIPNSDEQPFYVESLLVINSFTGPNSSPAFKYNPIDRACIGKCFSHNPGAFDEDGDSLSFAITGSRGINGQPILGYTFPDAGAGGTFSINPITGRLTWCSPQLQGEYNMAFVVLEWRRNTSGVMEVIGSVLRDMQVLVEVCPNNDPPLVMVPSDTCVEAGTLVNKKIVVSDPNSGNKVSLFGEAGAFAGELPRATLTNTSAIVIAPGNKFEATFSWQTSCTHVRRQSYQTVFKAEDDQDPKQVFFNTYTIKVVAPAVKNVSAIPQGASIKLVWSQASCNPSTNPLVLYKIYRQKGCDPIPLIPCGPAIPAGSGFKKIGETAATTFTDNNQGDGLIVGEFYSYVIVTVYKDGAESFGSTQVCAQLKRDVPVITNVDILSTSQTGSVLVKWLRPLTTAGNLDLSQFPGPYRFDLKHRISATDSYSTIYSTTHAVFTDLEETFTHSLVNTIASSHEYLIEFFSGTVTVGSSQKASSVFLTTTPADRKIDLQWSAKTPWDNFDYTVFRQDPGTNTFVAVGNTSLTSYSDTKNVENGKNYCYFIRSQGAYSDPTILKPLVNNSQQSCATAKDLTPPVTPTLSIDANCPSGDVDVSWTDIVSQSDDVDYYELYYKPAVNEAYEKVATVKKGQQLVFRNDNVTSSFAGCYAVKAIDINKNEGQLSPDFCIDNCPEFELPNIFTPNGDSINDYFKAVKVRQIKQIELTVTDRWGNLVYKTSDPYFHWNGVSQFSKLPVSEGTFFYVCDVFEPRIKGLIKRTIKGYMQVVR